MKHGGAASCLTQTQARVQRKKKMMWQRAHSAIRGRQGKKRLATRPARREREKERIGPRKKKNGPIKGKSARRIFLRLK